MPRPLNPREIEGLPETTWFKPAGVPMRQLEEIVLSFDELEALRLADAEGLYQEEVAERMKVSRPTVGRILAAARGKVADALVHGKAIRVEGGTVTVRGGCGRGHGRGGGRRHRGGCRETPTEHKLENPTEE